MILRQKTRNPEPKGRGRQSRSTGVRREVMNEKGRKNVMMMSVKEQAICLESGSRSICESHQDWEVDQEDRHPGKNFSLAN